MFVIDRETTRRSCKNLQVDELTPLKINRHFMRRAMREVRYESKENRNITLLIEILSVTFRYAGRSQLATFIYIYINR